MRTRGCCQVQGEEGAGGASSTSESSGGEGDATSVSKASLLPLRSLNGRGVRTGGLDVHSVLYSNS